jgi:hypothetical protein
MSYRDYPKAASDKASSGIKRNKALDNKCATQVGKVRAQQIAQRKPLSKKTLERTHSYLSRAQTYVNPDNPNTCGSISHDLWGSPPMLRYTKKKLNK